MIRLNNIIVLVSLSMINALPTNFNPRGFNSDSHESFSVKDCENHCVAIQLLNPLCASNGQTYPNDDFFECAKKCNNNNIHKLHYGNCQKTPTTIISHQNNPSLFPSLFQPIARCGCPSFFIYSPICGSDGQTYPNFFELRCNNDCYGKNVRIVHIGECTLESSLSRRLIFV